MAMDGYMALSRRESDNLQMMEPNASSAGSSPITVAQGPCYAAAPIEAQTLRTVPVYVPQPQRVSYVDTAQMQFGTLQPIQVQQPQYSVVSAVPGNTTAVRLLPMSDYVTLPMTCAPVAVMPYVQNEIPARSEQYPQRAQRPAQKKKQKKEQKKHPSADAQKKKAAEALSPALASVTDIPPCTHNMWTRQKWLNDEMCCRLRCIVCRENWHTQMTTHTKCPKFYSGACKGECGNPHIYARGVRPTNIVLDSTGTRVLDYELLSLRNVKSKLKDKRRAAERGTTEDTDSIEEGDLQDMLQGGLSSYLELLGDADEVPALEDDDMDTAPKRDSPIATLLASFAADSQR